MSILLNQLVSNRIPGSGEGEVAELAGLSVLDGLMPDVGLVEVESAAAQQALVRHLPTNVLVTSAKILKKMLNAPFSS